MRKSVIAFVLASVALNGCGARIKSYAGAAPGAGVLPGDTVCVVVAPDGTDRDTVYRGSGNVVATHILGVVRRTWPTAILIEPKPLSQAQPVAAEVACTYAIVPLITTWEDRPYWQGRDHIVITMHLMQVGPWIPSRSVTFDQHSGNVATHDTPASDILNDGFDQAISVLLAPPAGAVQAVKGDGIVPVPLGALGTTP